MGHIITSGSYSCTYVELNSELIKLFKVQEGGLRSFYDIKTKISLYLPYMFHLNVQNKILLLLVLTIFRLKEQQIGFDLICCWPIQANIFYLNE